MKFERNIQALTTTLQSLGFEHGLESALRAQVCFQPERFTITARTQKDPDVMDFVLHFEMHDSNGYACRYYDAILRKRTPLEEQVIGDVTITALDKRMSQVDWNLPQHSSHSTREREEAIDSIITDLKKLDAHEEGRRVSELLRLKYWPGTLVETMLGGSGSLKGKQEISQRFYFFDGRSQITVEEAYRYLCNRWLEKELNARKKQIEVPGVDETLVAGAEGGGSKKGAVKKGRRSGK